MIIIGAGAIAKWTYEICSRNQVSVQKFLDPIGGMAGRKLFNTPILKYTEEELRSIDPKSGLLAVCLNDLKLATAICTELETKGFLFRNNIHPDSTISSTVSMGKGNMISNGVMVGPDVQIGSFCVIHSGAIVEHNSILGDHIIIAPAATLNGHVEVGEYTQIYSGAIVKNSVKIGKNTIVGAGALVLKDVPDNVVAFGSPAEVVRKNR